MKVCFQAFELSLAEQAYLRTFDQYGGRTGQASLDASQRIDSFCRLTPGGGYGFVDKSLPPPKVAKQPGLGHEAGSPDE